VKHAKNCQFKPEDKVINTRYLRGESALLLTNPVSPSNANAQLIASVLKLMQQDTITDTARSHEVILTFGAFFFLADTLRFFSFLVFLSFFSLSSSIKPAKFDLIVKAVRSVCGYQLTRNGNPATIGIPSLALKLGNNLRKCAAIICGFALRRKDSQLKEDVNSYLELHDSEWASKISSALYTCDRVTRPKISLSFSLCLKTFNFLLSCFLYFCA